MKTMHCVLEGPANALATNRDATQVVVAGRNVFKIFSIEDEEFLEKLNLRVGKNLNLNFSCADVVWNNVEDHILATAATNGAVLTWNLNKTSRSKQDMIFQDHKRTVNKVSFHPNEPHLLLSGSQDGTMKCFDLRKKEASCTFHSMSESVRDVKFSPHQYFMFAAVQENGNVQLWDMRRPDRFERQFTAHNGPVFSCDWHPEDKRWLASAGRDKTIKVWDISYTPHLEHCIQTIASVALVKWRPQRKYHIASSSLVVDFSINIWDIRRPYVPFASFNQHKDVATGFAWRQDPHVLLSTSKDCTLYLNVFREAVHPADHVIPVGLDLSNRNNMCYSISARIFSETNVTSKTASYSSTRLPNFFRKVPNLSEQFRSASSYLMEFSNESVDKDTFLRLALDYKLTGQPFGDLCEHNAAVANDQGLHQIGQSWLILKLFFVVSPLITLQPDANGANEKGDHEGLSPSRHNSGSGLLRGSRHVSGANPETSETAEDDSDQSESDHNLTHLITGIGNMQSDFFFGDGESNQLVTCDFKTFSMMDNSHDWELPQEAFQPRHAIHDCSPPADYALVPSSPASADEDDYDGDQVAIPSDVEDHSKSLLMTSLALVDVPPMSFKDTLKELFHFYSQRGDVQTTVSMLLVLGEKAKGLIEEAVLETWLMSYIDLLGGLQLWNVSNQVILLAGGQVGSLNQNSTTFNSLCGQCRKPLTRVGYLCDKCKQVQTECNFCTRCSICHQVVRGLFVWCQGCCHGGHLHHLRDWFKDHSWCPSGCGHHCEYT